MPTMGPRDKKKNQIGGPRRSTATSWTYAWVGSSYVLDTVDTTRQYMQRLNVDRFGHVPN